jgi:ribosome biogenesis GTPase
MNPMGGTAWLSTDQAGVEAGQGRLARVTAVHKDGYLINPGTAEARAQLTGRLQYTADSVLELPTVGDWVWAQFMDDDQFAIIHQVAPRKSLLTRKTPGKKVDHQLIAANLDTAFIVQDLGSNFSLRRLERYLVMVHQGGIQPVMLLSKSDLFTGDEIDHKITLVKQAQPDLQVHVFSNLDDIGLAGIKELMQPQRTYCLLGSSGVGKTSLLNRLLGGDQYATRDIRQKDGKGRHTTTRRELIRLPGGALLIDTPGMRELGNLEAGEGLESTFDDLTALAAGCRFGDCSHTREKGCAILSALDAGELSQERYQSYLRLNREADFNQMSYQEKRRKDKKFGKMIKSIMKSSHKKPGI